MNRRTFTLAAATLCANAGSSVAVAGTATDLIGTWRILSYVDQAEDGSKTYPYGKQPIGVLTYDASGHMAVQITKAPAKGAAGQAGTRVPGSEKPEAAYTAYFGTYAVDWETRVITHTVEGNLFPVFIGTKHERPFELAGDRLELKPRWKQEGKQFTGTRVFERLR